MPRTLTRRVNLSAFLLTSVVIALGATQGARISSSAANARTGGAETSEGVATEVVNSGAACGLGVRWDVTEGSWTGVWTRQGNGNMFSAVWSTGAQQTSATLTINIQGDSVSVARRQSSDGNDCDYTGTIAADGVTVQGTYQCTSSTAFPSWQATIRCDSGLCASAPSGIVGWWSGNGNANDVVSQNNGSLQNGATFTTGEVGQGFNLDGQDDFINIPDSNSLDAITSTTTVEAWIRPEIPSATWGYVVGRRTPNVTENFSVAVYSDGKIGVIVRTTNIHPNGTTFVSPAGVIQFGHLQHIAATFTGSTGTARVYVNGQEQSLTLFDGLGGLSGQLANADTFFIGRRQDLNDIGGIEGAFGAAYYKGVIDELSLYNRALSASEIQSIYSAGSVGKCGVPPQAPRNPLIFIPGVAGSGLRTFNVGVNSVWPYSAIGGVPFDALTLDPSLPITRLYANDAIRRLGGYDVAYGYLLDRLTATGNGGGGYVEYQVNNDPTKRTSIGCDLNQKKDHPDLFVFAYDWRLSNATNAILLKDYVKCVQQFYPDTRIDLLTHSMGGLVARRYILDNPGLVDRLVTIASPWLGAPKAINTLETGDFFNDWKDSVNSSSLKRLVEYYPGPHELIPSRGYIAMGGVPFTESEWDADDNGRVDGNYTDYQQLVNELDHRYPKPGQRPGTRNKNFHDRAGQDNWNTEQGGSNPDPTAKNYHIFGKQPDQKTISNVATIYKSKCLVAGFRCKTEKSFYVNKDYGDGTVPVLSASRIGNGKNWNALGVTPVPICTDDDHTGLAQNALVLDYVLSILRGSPPASLGPCNATNQAGYSGEVRAGLAADAAKQAYYLTISGVASATVTDTAGNSTAPVSGMAVGGRVPGVNTAMLDADTFFIAMSVDNSYTVTFRTGTEPIAAEVTRGTNSETVQAIRYTDLSLPMNVTASITFTPQGVSDLRYDSDNDGINDKVVAPTASLAGISANDTAPPLVTISGTLQQNMSTIKVEATDGASGVKGIYYSLDGTQFQSYSGSFTLNATDAPVVYAFADDNSANRSATIIFYPSTTTNQIDNDQFFARRHYLDFLNREPDSSGLQFWTKEITSCGTDAQCREVKRINVSAAFFLSIEFQQTGYLAYRARKVAFGDLPSKPVPITREEILSDMSQVGDAVIVGQGDWEQRLEFNKRAYFDALVATDRFTTLYPQSLVPEQYVDALNSNAGGVLSQPEKDLLVAELKSGAKSRAQALRAVAEDAGLTKAEFNKAFVLMQFFGYLRRDPDSAPDSDFSGFNFWLGKLNQFNGNFIQAEMVKAFLDSIEYRKRFGQ